MLCHLPPLKVRLVLSSLYPIFEPPTIVSLGAPLGVESHQWLSKRSTIQIEQRIVEMWSEDREAAGEGSGVIWRWWEWIGSGEFLSDLGLLQDDTLRYVDPGIRRGTADTTGYSRVPTPSCLLSTRA